MKKIIALFVIFVCVGAALSAQMSFGGGALIDYGVGNGMKWKDGKDYEVYGAHAIGFGVFGFVDFTYAEVDVDFTYNIPFSMYYRSRINDKKDSGSESFEGGNLMMLGLSVLGKYPISMGGGMTVYPAGGFGYNIALIQFDKDGKNAFKDIDGESAAEWCSQFSIYLGGGLDYDIDRSLYFRVQALAHIRFSTKEMREWAKDDSNTRTTLGLGPRIKIGLGYRF